MKDIQCEVIANVVLKKTNNDYELISVKKFVGKGAMERHRLIKEKLVEFVDYEGNPIDLLSALQAITVFIKKLRELGGIKQILQKDT